MEISKNDKNEHLIKYAKTLKLFEKKEVHTPKSKYGLLYSESLNLLFQKLGITEAELNAINKKSLTYTRSMAAKYAKLSKESKIGKEEIKSFLSGYPFFRNMNKPDIPGDPEIPKLLFIGPNPYGYGQVHVEGRGTGLLADGWGDDHQYNQTYVGFDYKFRVPNDGYYKASALTIGNGNYYLIADDGACNSKEANCQVQLGGYIYQDYSNTQIFNPQLNLAPNQMVVFGDGSDTIKQNNDYTFYDEGQNINTMNIFGLQKNLQFNNAGDQRVWLTANLDIIGWVYWQLSVEAKGEGSVADINCNDNGDGTGGGVIYCEGINIVPD